MRRERSDRRAGGGRKMRETVEISYVLTPTRLALLACTAGMIGNILDRSIGNTLSTRRRGARSHSRAQRTAPTTRPIRSLELTGMIDGAELERAEANVPNAAIMLCKADRFADW